MCCNWTIRGTIKTTGDETQTRAIVQALEKEGMFVRHKNKYTIEFLYDDDGGYCLPVYVAEALSRTDGIVDGEFTSDSGGKCMDEIYRWNGDEFDCFSREDYTYYPGLEDEFIRQLPEAVIDQIKASLQKPADTPDSSDAEASPTSPDAVSYTVTAKVTGYVDIPVTAPDKAAAEKQAESAFRDKTLWDYGCLYDVEMIPLHTVQE